jgi:hypothetical protein
MDPELAGEGVTHRGSFAEVVANAAVLAFFIPAETAHGNVFGSEILESAKEGVVFGDLEVAAADLDLDKTFEGTVKRSGGAHASA